MDPFSEVHGELKSVVGRHPVGWMFLAGLLFLVLSSVISPFDSCAVVRQLLEVGGIVLLIFGLTVIIITEADEFLDRIVSGSWRCEQI